MFKTHAVMLSAALAFVGCGVVDPPGTETRSQKTRLTTAAPQDDLSKAVTDSSWFALDVYRKVAATSQGNVAYSPLSLSTALSMTLPGARGATQTAMEKTMRLSMPQDRYHRAINELDRQLASRGANSQNVTRPFKLRSNNQLFTQKNYPIETDFLDVLAVEYGAGVRQLDFKKSPEPSRKAINDWVSANTNRLIPELLAQGIIDENSRLALVNTLYFDAAWKKAFDKNKTAAGDFIGLDGTKRSVQMMLGEGLGAKSGSVGDTKVLELPYDGDEVSMVVVIPPEARGEVGGLPALEASLDGQKLNDLVAAATKDVGAVRMPKFTARTTGRLDEALKSLGMSVAFSDAADFTGLANVADEKLRITAVVQEAVVKVDESGTEAAAASAVVVGNRSAIVEPFTVDRPFLFFIRDRATGAVLFLGRVVDPS